MSGSGGAAAAAVDQQTGLGRELKTAMKGVKEAIKVDSAGRTRVRLVKQLIKQIASLLYGLFVTFMLISLYFVILKIWKFLKNPRAKIWFWHDWHVADWVSQSHTSSSYWYQSARIYNKTRRQWLNVNIITDIRKLLSVSGSVHCICPRQEFTCCKNFRHAVKIKGASVVIRAGPVWIGSEILYLK